MISLGTDSASRSFLNMSSGVVFATLRLRSAGGSWRTSLHCFPFLHLCLKYEWSKHRRPFHDHCRFFMRISSFTGYTPIYLPERRGSDHARSAMTHCHLLLLEAIPCRKAKRYSSQLFYQFPASHHLHALSVRPPRLTKKEA
jgi:hypothetical protein